MSNAVPAPKNGAKPLVPAVAPAVMNTKPLAAPPIETTPIQTKLDTPPVLDNKPTKKALFEKYTIAQSNVERAEIEASSTLKCIRDNYGKGPFRMHDGLKTIVEREKKDAAGVVIRSLFFLRAVGGEIQEIE